ncbi:MAG: hypothetical protein ACE3L7_01785 [Candidatus Pristimantibacillus sp.]
MTVSIEGNQIESHEIPEIGCEARQCENMRIRCDGCSRLFLKKDLSIHHIDSALCKCCSSSTPYLMDNMAVGVFESMDTRTHMVLCVEEFGDLLQLSVLNYNWGLTVLYPAMTKKGLLFRWWLDDNSPFMMSKEIRALYDAAIIRLIPDYVTRKEVRLLHAEWVESQRQTAPLTAVPTIEADQSQLVTKLNFEQIEISDRELNDMAAHQFLSTLCGNVTTQQIDWNPDAIAEVKAFAFDTLQKYFAIEVSDHPRDILLRQAKEANSMEEIQNLGFVYEEQLNRYWYVDGSIAVWRNPDDIFILTESVGGLYFTCYGEKTPSLIQKLVISYRFTTFVNKGMFVYPKDSKFSSTLRFVWDIDMTILKEILDVYPSYHVYSLIATDTGQQIVPGARFTSMGYILTRNYLFIDAGICIPADLEES